MPKAVQYHKENRAKSYHKMLTTDDRDMPSNYYTMWELGKALQITTAKMREYRRNSYEALKEICETNKIKNFEKYWNENVHKFDSTVNFFLKDEKLRPVAHLIRLKVVTRLSTRSDIEQLPQKYASFGIIKSYWDKYVIDGKIAHPENRKNPIKYDLNEKGRGFIRIGDDRIFVPKTEIFEKFKSGMKAQGLTLGEGATVAMKEYMENHPQYFEALECIPDPYKTYNPVGGLVATNINPKVADEMRKIIKNYNSVNPIRIRMSSYVESAIKDKNASVPLKYRNPEKYLMKLEQEKWLKEVAEKKGENING